MARTIPGHKAAAAIRRMNRIFLPALERQLLGRTASVAYASIIDEQRVDTNTLRSSTNVAPGSAQGRGLTYGPGNTPLPVSVVEQALAARRFGEQLVIAEDAQSTAGFFYGVVVEEQFGTFANAQSAAMAAVPAIAKASSEAALRETLT